MVKRDFSTLGYSYGREFSTVFDVVTYIAE